MSLLVDRRIGSNDLQPALAALGLPAVMTTLDYGDVAWTGFGEDGPVSCACEVKTVGDLLQSMQSGRLAGHQLPGLIANYDRVYLIIEEATRPEDGGINLQHYVKGQWWRTASIGRGNFNYRSYERFLTTLVENGQVRLRQTTNRAGTIATIATLYQWWMDGAPAHTSHLALDKTTQQKLQERARAERGGGVSFIRGGPTFKRRIAAELPGIGLDRSAAVAESFGSVREMVNADEKRWTTISGIGKGIAKKIVDAVSGKGPER